MHHTNQSFLKKKKNMHRGRIVWIWRMIRAERFYETMNGAFCFTIMYMSHTTPFPHSAQRCIISIFCSVLWCFFHHLTFFIFTTFLYLIGLKWENVKITMICGTGQKMCIMQICVVYVMDQFFDTFMYINQG